MKQTDTLASLAWLLDAESRARTNLPLLANVPEHRNVALLALIIRVERNGGRKAQTQRYCCVSSADKECPGAGCQP